MLGRRTCGAVLATTLVVGAPSAVHAWPPTIGDPLLDAEGHSLVYPDPLEALNRRTFALNRRVDRWVLDPVTWAYRRVPAAARRTVRRFFTNLNAPSGIVNDLLQREWRDAGVLTARTAVNTTIGIAGLTDPATPLGLRHHDSDFGQTLALAGLGSGPYLIVPLLGPTTVRDGLGTLIDFAFRPTTYLLGSAALADAVPLLAGGAGVWNHLIYQAIQGTGTGFVERERNATELAMLRQTSVDFYAALRSAYTQAREGAIWHRWERHHAASHQP